MGGEDLQSKDPGVKPWQSEPLLVLKCRGGCPTSLQPALRPLQDAWPLAELCGGVGLPEPFLELSTP